MKDLDYAGCDLLILVYSIDHLSTFEKMETYYDAAIKICHQKRPHFVLIGNKVDLDGQGLRLVPKQDGEMLKKELKLDHFVETNAQNRQHVTNVFDEIRDILVNKLNTDAKKGKSMPSSGK